MTSSRKLFDVGKLDPNDSTAPYLQVSEDLRSDIRAGRFKAGDKLPTHAAVADEYGVSVGTVKRAFTELQSGGLIVTRQGQGSYVCDVDVEALTANGADPMELRQHIESLERRVADIERRLSAGGES